LCFRRHSAISAESWGKAAVRILIAPACGVLLFSMLVVGPPDGGVCNRHDHLFEKASFDLGRGFNIDLDGQEFTLQESDFA
jgi:glyoxylate utilization-related uncharacterized protein